MIDDFTKLHHSVPQTLVTNLTSLGIERKSTVLGNTVINHLLPRGQLDFDHHFRFGWEFFLNFTFDSSQQKWSKNLM